MDTGLYHNETYFHCLVSVFNYLVVLVYV